MNRRAFIGALAAIVAAPAVALRTKFVPLMIRLSEYCWQTPCGEAIADMKIIAGDLFVYTARAVYRMPA